MGVAAGSLEQPVHRRCPNCIWKLTSGLRAKWASLASDAVAVTVKVMRVASGHALVDAEIKRRKSMGERR